MTLIIAVMLIYGLNLEPMLYPFVTAVFFVPWE